MSILLDAIFDLLFGGLVHGRGGRRTHLDGFFGKAYSVVIAFWAVITGVYACTAVLARDTTSYWLPLVIAFVGAAVCGAMLGKRPHVYLAGGFAACTGACAGMAVGLFGLFMSLMTFK